MLPINTPPQRVFVISALDVTCSTSTGSASKTTESPYGHNFNLLESAMKILWDLPNALFTLHFKPPWFARLVLRVGTTLGRPTS